MSPNARHGEPVEGSMRGHGGERAELTAQVQVDDVDPQLLAELEAQAVEIACAASRLVRDQRPDRIDFGTKSSATDVVTVMDEASERLIRELVHAARPDDGFLGEEGDDEPGSSGVTWVVDPIDGTVNYLYGQPAYAVSVAAATGDPHTPGAWRVLAGAVADCTAHEVAHARLGGGAWLRPELAEGKRMPACPGTGHADQARRLQVTAVTDLGQALVATGFAYAAPARARQAATLTSVLPVVRDIRRGGSAALDLLFVARGLVDGYYEQGPHPWDVAAGWLLVTEAGGKVAGPDGREILDGGIIAAAPGVFDALGELLVGATTPLG